MLADQQVQSVPGCHELHRELAAATDTVSRARIITTEQETLIAQLTVTALHDSPVDRTNIWLTVRMGAAAGPASAGHHSGAPVAGTREGH